MIGIGRCSEEAQGISRSAMLADMPPQAVYYLSYPVVLLLGMLLGTVTD